jgi:hypothetical protein
MTNSNLPLPPYYQRRRLIDIDRLNVRRRIASVMFFYDILSNKYDCTKNSCCVNATPRCVEFGAALINRFVVITQQIEWMAKTQHLNRFT